MNIIQANIEHLESWTKLAIMLFPDSTFEEELKFHKEIVESEKEVGFLYEKDDRLVGFMNISIRSDYVNGTDTSPVVYIEAIYVLSEYRKYGIGRKFIEHAEQYAKQKGITQLASDCFIDNTISESFHKSCGFVEKERVICFVKNVE
ncbi:MAG: GNAT family N-acetyltransferase [Oscillospiraceae bacterium]|nr:GNAT family N-acetyltransferase [Oscillospiraceae bacterium]